MPDLNAYRITTPIGPADGTVILLHEACVAQQHMEDPSVSSVLKAVTAHEAEHHPRKTTTADLRMIAEHFGRQPNTTVADRSGRVLPRTGSTPEWTALRRQRCANPECGHVRGSHSLSESIQDPTRGRCLQPDCYCHAFKEPAANA